MYSIVYYTNFCVVNTVKDTGVGPPTYSKYENMFWIGKLNKLWDKLLYTYLELLTEEQVLIRNPEAKFVVPEWGV